MKKVSIYLGMTWEDMYSERKLLYQEVFPALKSWCREKQVELEVMDPGFDATERTCQENPLSLLMHLKSIDRCRPFYLGFLGQHRGFVPTAQEVSPDILMKYPGIGPYLGQQSFQELCLLHAILEPFREGIPADNRCLLYLREDEYLKDMLKANPKLRPIYTNEPSKKTFFSRESKKQTEEMERFQEELGEQVPLIRYRARWKEDGKTEELASHELGDLSEGCLFDFRVPAQFGSRGTDDGSLIDQIIPPQNLKDHILEHMKAAIEAELPRIPDLMDGEPEKYEVELDSFYVSAMKMVPPEEQERVRLLPGFEKPVVRRILLKEFQETGDREYFFATAPDLYGDEETTAFQGMIKRLLGEAESEWLEDFLGFLAFHEDGIIWERFPSWQASRHQWEETQKLPEESRYTIFYLSDFLESNDDGVTCLYDTMRKAITQVLAEKEASFHLVLTADYLEECKPIGTQLHDCRFEGTNAESYRRLSWHAARSYMEMLEVLLGNPYYITRKIQLCGMADVLSDFDFLQFSPRKEEFRQLHRILSLSSRVLTIDPFPSQLYVQLLLRQGEEDDAQTNAMIDILKDDRTQARLLPVQKYGEDADSPLEGSFEVALNRTTRPVFWNQFLVTLTENQIIIYDKISGKITKRTRLPQKKPNLFFCGSALLCSGTLEEPVCSFTPEHCENRVILSPHPGEKSGPVFLFSDGEELKLLTTREGNALAFLDTITGKEEKTIPLEEGDRLLGADEGCYIILRYEEGEDHILLYEQKTDRLLGKTTISEPEKAILLFCNKHALVCCPDEVLVFDRKSGELKQRFVTNNETKELGGYRQIQEDHEFLYLTREHGFVDVYDKETLEFVSRLKLHEDAVVAIASNRVNLFTLDEKGKVCVWNRGRLNRKENEGTDSDALIRDIFQANGSVYTFSRSHSTAMSPGNLKVRRKGIPVFHYNPEVRLRRYLVHWYKEPLKLMLMNTETLQNDYTCVLDYPEGYGPDDLLRCYWEDTTGYLLFRRASDGHVAVQVLDMNTDKLVRTVEYGDYR